jgi:hypothetical protein
VVVVDCRWTDTECRWTDCCWWTHGTEREGKNEEQQQQGQRENTLDVEGKEEEAVAAGRKPWPQEVT